MGININAEMMAMFCMDILIWTKNLISTPINPHMVTIF